MEKGPSAKPRVNDFDSDENDNNNDEGLDVENDEEKISLCDKTQIIYLLSSISWCLVCSLFFFFFLFFFFLVSGFVFLLFLFNTHLDLNSYDF